MLLLGGSGYLGTQITNCLEQDGEHEMVSTCFTAESPAYLLRLDVTDKAAFTALLKEFNPEVVIWALMSRTDEHALITSGLNTLLEHLTEKSKLIYISSDGVFGQGTGGLGEDDEVIPLEETNPLAAYSHAKSAGEVLIRSRHDNHVIARIGPIYGRNCAGIWDKRVAAMQVELKAGREVVRAANLYKTFIHVEDVGRAITELTASSYTGTLHLGPEQKESYYSFFWKMAELLGMDTNLVKENQLSAQEARERGIPLDTSLDTRRARQVLHTPFRLVSSSVIRK